MKLVCPVWRILALSAERLENTEKYLHDMFDMFRVELILSFTYHFPFANRHKKSELIEFWKGATKSLTDRLWVFEFSLIISVMSFCLFYAADIGCVLFLHYLNFTFSKYSLQHLAFLEKYNVYLIQWFRGSASSSTTHQNHHDSFKDPFFFDLLMFLVF